MTDDVSTSEGIVADIGQRPHGTALVVAGNFNDNIEDPEGKHHK